LKDLIELIAKSLVDNPEMVEVNQITKDTSIILEVKVAPDDMGKIIGKQGKIAKAIRTLAKAAATKEGVKVSVEICR
jgi:predicted RNA-binding protein YlqC (UPF0109 family)